MATVTAEQKTLWEQPREKRDIPSRTLEERGLTQPGLWDEFAAASGRSFELYPNGPLANLPQLPGYQARGPRPQDYAQPPARTRQPIPLGPIGSTEGAKTARHGRRRRTA